MSLPGGRPLPRIAITTDWLTSFGGAERVLQHLHVLYPNAPIYTSVFDPHNVPEDVRAWDVRPSILQRFPAVRRYSRALLPLMPWAFERFDLDAYDVVITASSAFSKNVTVPPGAINLCYCHTPPRYLWDLTEGYVSGVKRAVSEPAIRWLRSQDLRAAARVDEFIANSRHVAGRIERMYGRTATVVYPPVDTERIRPNGHPPDDFYLVVGRLVAYKRIDLAVAACTRLGRRLVVVGAGPELERLRAIAGPSVHFAGRLDDVEVTNLYARCKAFIFPGLEDFGITSVEAQAAGRPIVAYRAGGATETVVDGVTGVFFEQQSVSSLINALEQLDRIEIDPLACRVNATRFDARIFRERMGALVEGAYTARSANPL